MMSQEEKDEKFEQVCQLIEQGRSLRSIFCGHNPPMSNTAFYGLLREDPSKNERYARAREIFADTIFDEILEIADESNADVNIDDDGKMYVNGEVVARSRLKVDARKWMLSKLQPKKYGDRIEVDQKTEATITWKEEKTYVSDEAND